MFDSGVPYVMTHAGNTLTLGGLVRGGWRTRNIYTRQMMIIAGGKPELCCRWHAKREGGVYGRPYALRVHKSCPECSVHMLCLCRKV